MTFWLPIIGIPGLLSASLQKCVVLHDEPDLLDGQLDDHLSDFGGALFTDDLCIVLDEDLADLVTVVGVLRHDCWQDLLALVEVAVGRVELCQELLLLLCHPL